MERTGSLGPYTVETQTEDLQAAVARGRVFGVASQAGVTSQIGLSVTTPVLTLANPAGSGVKARLHYASATFLVAFGAAAAVWLAAGTNTVAAVVTGTLTTAHRKTSLGGLTAQGNRVVPFLAATLPAIPVAISLLGVGLTGTIGTIPAAGVMERWYNGAIELLPGTNISVQTSTASGAASMLNEYVWEEVDL